MRAAASHQFDCRHGLRRSSGQRRTARYGAASDSRQCVRHAVMLKQSFLFCCRRRSVAASFASGLLAMAYMAVSGMSCKDVYEFYAGFSADELRHKHSMHSADGPLYLPACPVKMLTVLS